MAAVDSFGGSTVAAVGTADTAAADHCQWYLKKNNYKRLISFGPVPFYLPYKRNLLHLR